MLIQCPECKREISDKAKHCIHCGCPISELDENKNEIDTLYEEIKKYNCPICKQNKWVVAKSNNAIKCEFCGYTHFNENNSKNRNDSKDKYEIRCPKCGSTNIQMVQRKFSLLTGFATNKVDRVCVNCKHKF